MKNGPVSALQTAMIEKNDVLAKVMREVVIDPYCTVDPKSIGYNEILRQLARETVARENRYRFGTGNPSPTGPAGGGAGGRAWMPGGGNNAAAAAFAPQGEGFGSGGQGNHAASAERNGANWEAAQGAGADALDAGDSFEQRQAENAADWETTEDFPVEESAEHGIMEDEEIPQKNPDRRNDFKYISQKRFDSLTVEARKNGAIILRGTPEVEKHLIEMEASASHIGGALLFMKNVCITDVLEETYHYMQNLRGLNDDKEGRLRTILNEIDAKQYLLDYAQKYKIPRNEIEHIREQLEGYKKQLEDYWKE